MSNRIKIAWRLCVTAVCAFFLAAVVCAFIETAQEWLEDKNRGQDIEKYDSYLYGGDYMGLQRQLGYHAPQGEVFQQYWDVADAYECFSLYRFWQLVKESGLTEENREAGQGETAAADRYQAEYLERLIHIYENSGETARRHIESFAGELVR